MFELNHRIGDISIIRDIWEQEVYEQEVKVGSGSVVVDAGAQIGAFSVKASKQVGGAGIVYAFEPEPENFQYLIANTEHLNNVRIFNKALWSSEGKKLLYLHPFNVGAHSLYPPREGDNGTLEVETTSLDDMIKGKVDFMKIDVEGAELEVLKGAQHILEQFHPFIAVEIHSNIYEDICVFLSNYGYDFVSDKRGIGVCYFKSDVT
jgi:FkbM family methyltransferase